MVVPSGKLDVLVFRGRFQPLHIGHQYVIDQALTKADHVILLVGSANLARNPRNPFTAEERMSMIKGVWSAQAASKQLIPVPLGDRLYNDTAWVASVQKAVQDTLAATPEIKKNPRIGLIGYGKDNTSYYLKMFPDWEAVDVSSQYGTFNATEIRDAYIQANPVLPSDSCPEPVVEFMRSFRLTKPFKDLLDEANFVRDYKRKWSGTPYPPTFVSVHAVVEQSGHVLLIERANWPGKGLWALPGGLLPKTKPCAMRWCANWRKKRILPTGMGRYQRANSAHLLRIMQRGFTMIRIGPFGVVQLLMRFWSVCRANAQNLR